MKTLNRMFFLPLFICLSASFLSGSELRMQTIKGYSAFPVLSQSGELVLIYKNPSAGLSSAHQSTDTSLWITRTLFSRSNVSTPVIEKDRNGRLWTVWEEEYGDDSRIMLARMEEDELLEIRPISLNRGYHFSPDLTFDHINSPWVVWISYSEGRQSVRVKNMSSHRVWQLDGPFSDGAYSPQIVADASNRIWVIWTGNSGGRDELVGRYYDGTQWTPTRRLSHESRSPHILPSASLDGAGRPWVSWCSHDGSDYEIYVTRWDGYSWTPEERVTTNQVSDAQPCLSFVSGNIPVVVWIQAEGSSSRVCLRYKQDQAWSSVFELDRRSRAPASSPKIGTLGNKLGITWQAGGEIQTVYFSFHELQGQAPVELKSAIPAIPEGEWPDENKYIAFGDSITFGMIDYKETPQLGYVPRLESLLYKTYGPTQVINEGWPGEVTANGLARLSDVLELHKALYFLLMEGTNDVVFKRISMDTTVFNLEQMIQICRNKSVFPVLTTIIPRNDKRWEKPFFRDRIFELNDKIRDMSDRVQVSFIDMFEIFYNWPESDGGWTSLLSNDYVHPSIKGYEVMTESWFEEIMRFPFFPRNIKAIRLQEQVEDAHQDGNKITWNHSPKLYDQIDFRAYRIYRSKIGEESKGFSHIDTVSLDHRDAHITGSIVFPGVDNSGKNYLDLDIDPSTRYKYVLRLVRKDGVVGPSSRIAKDNAQGGTGH
jgi:lysophospholipase L1-like esterase